jgi:hypothetical protein
MSTVLNQQKNEFTAEKTKVSVSVQPYYLLLTVNGRPNPASPGSAFPNSTGIQHRSVNQAEANLYWNEMISPNSVTGYLSEYPFVVMVYAKVTLENGFEVIQSMSFSRNEEKIILKKKNDPNQNKAQKINHHLIWANQLGAMAPEQWPTADIFVNNTAVPVNPTGNF